MSVSEEESTEVLNPESTLMHGLVTVRDEEGHAVKDVAEVISASPTGAGFYINRDVKPGRLLSFMAPIEPQMRYYDHERELYRVWGLVQHCHKLNSEDGFHVGIAFIGREAPDSYAGDPMQSYRICGMNGDGMWKIQEAREFKPRKDARFYAAVDHYLAVVDAQKSGVKGERTVTENISKSGAAVVTTLDLHAGDRVKFISEGYDFSGLAVVCSRRSGAEGKTILSLQFVGTSFPVERISAAAQASKETKESPVLV